VTSLGVNRQFSEDLKCPSKENSLKKGDHGFRVPNIDNDLKHV